MKEYTIHVPFFATVAPYRDLVMHLNVDKQLNNGEYTSCIIKLL
jgi:hypothetical protein